MALPNTYWLYNNTANDGANTGNASGGAGDSSSNWVVIDLTNDALLFLDNQQTDGAPISGTKYAGLIPESGSIEVPKTFVKDASAAIYDQVPLAGTTNGGQSGGNTRYVFAIYFDGATASVPYLEAWDNSSHSTIIKTLLGGNGVDTSSPTDSTLLGITTTNAAPGSATWAGSPIAGASYRLSLDTGALAGAKNLYFNIKQVIPYTLAAVSDSDIVLALRFTYS
jgi:hypothetical protein